MNLLHWEKPGRSIFRRDQFLQCWQLGGVGCSRVESTCCREELGWVGLGRLAQRNQSHPRFWSPQPLSSKMCPLLIDRGGMAGAFSCPVLQKELVSLSHKKSPASDKGRWLPNRALFWCLASRVFREWIRDHPVADGSQVSCFSHPRRQPFPNPPRHVSRVCSHLWPSVPSLSGPSCAHEAEAWPASKAVWGENH